LRCAIFAADSHHPSTYLFLSPPIAYIVTYPAPPQPHRFPAYRTVCTSASSNSRIRCRPPEPTQRYPRSQHSDSAPQFEVNNYCRGWSITGTISRTFCVSPLPRWKSRDRVAPFCAVLQDELVAVILGQEKKKIHHLPQSTPRGCDSLRASPLHFAIQACISGIFRLEVAGCDVAQAGFLTLTFRLFELV
jgi:hypothetical protein